MKVGIKGAGGIMARPLNRLAARQVATLKKAGRHADGGGLYLRVSAAGTRSWAFMADFGGKRVEIGLGSANDITLSKVRELAGAMREALTLGNHPRSVLVAAKPVERRSIPTFGAFAEEYIRSVEAGWKNPVHRQQWRNSLRDHASVLSAVPVDQVNTELVMQVLQPIWLTKAETAGRVRGRIERILDAAKARGLRPRESTNPAAFKGHLAVLLAKRPGMMRGHHKALPHAEMPKFMAALRARSALAARCLEFTILTAARSGEALEATWGEIDLSRKLWTVPASRMKAGHEHVVPLCASAVELLENNKPKTTKPNDRVFMISGATRSNMAMTMLLRRMKVDNATVHGFRSTFRDWAGDETSFPRDLIEHALAHTIGSKAEQAYRRGSAIERRRKLMQQWDEFVSLRPTAPK